MRAGAAIGEEVSGSFVAHRRQRPVRPARREQHSKLSRAVVEGSRRDDGDAGIAGHRVACLAHQMHRRAHQRCEHVLRPDQVEDRHAWIAEHRDLIRLYPAGRHTAHVVAGMRIGGGLRAGPARQCAEQTH